MKKKVLMTASVYSHICNFHHPYLRRFQELGWETHVACAGAPGNAPWADRTLALPFEKKMFSPENFRAMRMLRRLIRSEDYDLIVTHTTLAAFFTRLAAKGVANRPPLVNVMHGYLFDGDTPRARRTLLLNAERLTAPETDLLLVMNAWDDDAARRWKLGKRIERIPGMGVDFTELDAAAPEAGRSLRRELGIPDDAFVLLCAAEFSRRKSQRVLIEAVRLLPASFRLVLCGEGDERPACQALAAELGVADRVLFPGQIAGIGRWYRMADALVAASRSEGLPFNVMEAMHTGLPVIASAVKGHTDLIEDGVTGLLYPYGDAERCADCARRLAGDAALRRAQGERAAAAAARYALPDVLPRVMEQYLSCSRGDGKDN